MNRDGKLHALLATSRVANIPSVVGNVCAGIMIALAYGHGRLQETPLHSFVTLPLAGVLLYVSGNFFNDWMDRSWDQIHRPERALPRGLFPASLYAILAGVLGVAGTGLAAASGATSGIFAASIVFWIIIYTLIHKRTTWGVIPMGLCRALLPVMGCTAFFPYADAVWPLACGLFCYIMGLSLSARYEAMAEPPLRIGIMARGLLLTAAVIVAWGNRKLLTGQLPTVAGVIPYLVWTSLCLRVWHKPVPLLVSRLLAGIPFVDWMVLLPLGISLALHGAASAGIQTAVCLALPPLAFLSALLLQRVAPAT